MYLPMFYSIALPACKLSYDCPSVCEVTLRHMGKISRQQTITKNNKRQVLFVFLIKYCTLFWTVPYEVEEMDDVNNLMKI